MTDIYFFTNLNSVVFKLIINILLNQYLNHLFCSINVSDDQAAMILLLLVYLFIELRMIFIQNYLKTVLLADRKLL